MNIKRKRAFTLVEVMVAVVILALTATAAIRLVMLGQEGLRGAKAEIMLTQEAKAIRTGIMLKIIEASGKRGDIIWETSEGTREMFGEDFGRLDLSGPKQTDMTVIKQDMRWKKIKVSNTKEERNIVIYVPYD
ncbi:MAG: type II secretion system protein [Synergistaceae bacterium]|nr:type II secretion system protein [Synergistaceae bacterium]